jgi:hypothetical protein
MGVRNGGRQMISMKELKESDPERYQEELERWWKYGGDAQFDDWWEHVISYHTEENKEVYCIDETSWDSDAWNNFTFASSGHLYLKPFFQRKGWDKQYPLHTAQILEERKYLNIVIEGRRCPYSGIDCDTDCGLYAVDGVGLWAGADEDEIIEEMDRWLNEVDFCKEVMDVVNTINDTIAHEMSQEYEYLTSEECFLEKELA